jgi:alpha-tubulin suppressor-like RCC1 family protein
MAWLRRNYARCFSSRFWCVACLQRQCVCGQSHTVLITRKGAVYTWGHAADGRLGVGTNKRLGVKEPESRYFPIPNLITSLKAEVVRQVGPHVAWSCTWSWLEHVA